MTTNYINPSNPVAKNNTGIIVGIIALIIFSLIFIYYGIPTIRNLGNSQINVPAPVINLPDEIDVNVQQTP